MTPEILGLVLFAALLHAAWNAIVQQSDDPLLAQWLVIAAGSVLCFPLMFVAAPPGPETWPWLALGVTIHTAYYLLLAESYRVGDLSQVYPLARGTAPPLVALASLMLIDEPISAGGLAGVGLVSVGVLSLAHGGAGSTRTVPLALVVGCLIAGYSVVDGMGVRSSASALTYIVWLEVLCGIPITVVALARRRGRVRSYLRTSGVSGAVGGLIAVLAYSAVLFAYSRAPLAEVSALRETSVIFGAGIGAFLLQEGFGPRRLAAAALVAVGIATLQLA